MTAHKPSAGLELAAHAAAAALADPLTNAAATVNPNHDFELERISTRHGTTSVSSSEVGTSELPPVDTGRGALTFLAAAFFLGRPSPSNFCIVLACLADLATPGHRVGSVGLPRCIRSHSGGF